MEESALTTSDRTFRFYEREREPKTACDGFFDPQPQIKHGSPKVQVREEDRMKRGKRMRLRMDSNTLIMQMLVEINTTPTKVSTQPHTDVRY